MGPITFYKMIKVPFGRTIKGLTPRTHLVRGFNFVERCMTDKLMCIDKRSCSRHIF
jgi:hypothetical protein